MDTVTCLPFAEVQFTKQGVLHDDREVDALLELLSQRSVTDLFVMSHGWNNDMEDARRLYRRFFDDSVCPLLAKEPHAALKDRRFAVLGVMWPSKKFTDRDLIPGGAASVGADDVERLEQLIADLKGVFDAADADARLEQARALLPDLEASETAQDEFVRLVQGLAPLSETDVEDGEAELATLPPDVVMERLSRPMLPAGGTIGSGGGAARIDSGLASPAGGAAGLGDLVSGAKSAARKLLNLVTYYQMKERAGIVGRDGLHPVLRRIREEHPDIRLHLIGHSFGGRLVTAAAAGQEDQPAVNVDTLTLLQAAFSHYGFAQKYDGDRDGFFRRVVAEGIVSGPVLITCTINDRAVGYLYPIASQLVGQVAAGLGDKDDPYGGIGRNGAQKTPEAIDGTLGPVDGTYEFRKGSLHNLVADTVIKNHGDITGQEIAHAVLTAVAMT